MLLRAAGNGLAVKVCFVGLASVELHLLRVAARVKAGGHDIPKEKIRERWQNSRLNLLRLLPHLRELILWDNSAEANFKDIRPRPVLLPHLQNAEIIAPKNLTHTPEWAQPIVAAAIIRAHRA